MIDVPMTFIPDANGGGTTFISGPDRPPAAKAPGAPQKKLKKARESGSGEGGASSNDEVSMFIPCEKPPGFLYQARTADIAGKEVWLTVPITFQLD
jgi:hypothetical protein